MNEGLIGYGNFILPKAASIIGSEVDSLLYFIIILSIVFFIPIVLTMGYFSYKYRTTNIKKLPKTQLTENHFMELSWTILPLILVMIIFYWGFRDYLKLAISPENAYEIHATGKKWIWVFDYPDTGRKSMNDLVVPVNTPVKLIMSSEDVLHSFYIPNMRIKKDVLPNRYTTLTFNANRIGDFQIFCTEYCGDGHSKMLANLKVLSQDDYKKWQREADSADDSTPLPELGKRLYEEKLCNTCHSLDGSKMSGPSWKQLYNAKRELTDGKVVIADDNYLRESIVNPKAKVVKGYMPVMPTYAGLLSDREINGIIEFIKVQK